MQVQSNYLEEKTYPMSGAYVKAMCRSTLLESRNELYLPRRESVHAGPVKWVDNSKFHENGVWVVLSCGGTDLVREDSRSRPHQDELLHQIFYSSAYVGIFQATERMIDTSVAAGSSRLPKHSQKSQAGTCTRALVIASRASVYPFIK
jgi:hypothetical protein